MGLLYLYLYCTAGHQGDNMAHAYYMLGTYGYKHTLRICSSYSFPTGKKRFTIASRRYVTHTFPVFCILSTDRCPHVLERGRKVNSLYHTAAERYWYICVLVFLTSVTGGPQPYVISLTFRNRASYI
jgi:hypothetical protein